MGLPVRHGRLELGVARLPRSGASAVLFLPVYLKNKIFTIPEYPTRRFGRLAGSTFALVCMVQYLVINLPAPGAASKGRARSSGPTA